MGRKLHEELFGKEITVSANSSSVITQTVKEVTLIWCYEVRGQ